MYERDVETFLTKFFRRVIIGLGHVGFIWNKQSSTTPVGSAFFFIDRDRRMRSSESPIPIFRLRPGLTRNVAEHKNVDSANERNWRFLFPSWRSSSHVLFYAPPLHSSSDSVVRKNTDWILDFTSFSAPHLLVHTRTLFWFICAISRGNVIINWLVVFRDKNGSLFRFNICLSVTIITNSNTLVKIDYKVHKQINIYVLSILC